MLELFIDIINEKIQYNPIEVLFGINCVHKFYHKLLVKYLSKCVYDGNIRCAGLNSYLLHILSDKRNKSELNDFLEIQYSHFEIN